MSTLTQVAASSTNASENSTIRIALALMFLSIASSE